MLYVGIDVAKNKHDCCILSDQGTIINDLFTFGNHKSGFDSFECLVKSAQNEANDFDLIVGLESTGHYSNNLVLFLQSRGYSLVVFNPLSTNLYRKAFSLRKTKTDKIDAKIIAMMLLSKQGNDLQSESELLIELKRFTRHRHRLGKQLSREKVQLTRILDVVFPELASCVWSIHQKSAYALLSNYPSTNKISKAHLNTITTLLSKASSGRYGVEKALEIKTAAKNSIGSNSTSLSIELSSTLRTIEHFEAEIDKIDKEIKALMIEIDSPILSIPGISYRLGSVILSEIRDINSFETPSKLLAFSGMDPSIYQSGKFIGEGTMVKRGSSHLRWALLQAARLVSMRVPTFQNYLNKKLKEGKHYYVALSHVAKKLSRTLFYLLKTNQLFDFSKSV